MSYTLTPIGLRGGKPASTADTEGSQFDNSIASGYANNLYIGDPVNFSAGVFTIATQAAGIITSFDCVFGGNEYEIGAPQPWRFAGAWVGGTVLKAGARQTTFVTGLTDRLETYAVVSDGPVANFGVIGQTANLNAGAGYNLNGTSSVSLNTASIGTGTAVLIVDVSQGVGGNRVGAGGPVTLLVRNAKAGI